MDMTIIAAHGYAGLKKMMSGSVALEVLHEAYMPAPSSQAGILQARATLKRRETATAIEAMI